MINSSIIFSLNECDSVDNIISSYNKLKHDIPLEKGVVQIDKFSDSEISVQYKSSLRGKKVFIHCSSNSSEDIIKICLAIDASKRASASETILILPCLPYSRQDKREGLRGAIGAKVIANMLQSVGLNRLITLDLHAEQIQALYDIVDHLEGHNLFIPYIKKLIKNGTLNNITLVSPDAGGVKRVDQYFKKLGKDYDNITFAMISKRRDKPNSIASMDLIGNVNGRDCIIIDDMVDTFGTARKAIGLLRENGANSVRMIASHGIFSGKAYSNIYESEIDGIIISDSLNQGKDAFGVSATDIPNITIISIADMLAKNIKAINDGISVSKILEESSTV